MSNERACDMCGARIEGARWLLLNRYGIGTGRTRALTERLDQNGNELWEMSDDIEEEYAAGVLLCWPACANDYIETRMVEADLAQGKL